MSLDKIKQIINSLAKSIDDNEKVATPILAAKLVKAVNTYPGDQTIGAVSTVISKMVANNNLFIRKADLKALYTKLYSNNTKFAEVFQDELGAVDNLATPKIYERDNSELKEYEVGDAILANALTSVFDRSVPLKLYSQKLANTALKSVSLSLDAWNLKPNSLVIDDGNDKFIVIRADYETPKGLTSIYIPVEVNNNKVLEASVFMANTGPRDLNHTEIKNYLTTNAGTRLKVSASGILHVLVKTASTGREISDAEIALTKLTALRQGKSEFFTNQVVGQKLAEEVVKDVEIQKSEDSLSFEEQFSTTHGEASAMFGDVVNKGIIHIARELSGFGYKNPQVSVAGTINNTIRYNVSLDAGRVGFVVPIKISAGKIVKPGIMLCNGSVMPFNKDGINDLYIKNASDFRAAAGASTLSALKPSEIVQNLRDAVADRNYAKAEDALNVLANSGDAKAYAMAFRLYMSGLANKENKVQTKCAHAMKSKVSQHEICSQTGLPVHKVYQDNFGNCRPLYRRSMDETYEGAVFNNHKIFG